MSRLTGNHPQRPNHQWINTKNTNRSNEVQPPCSRSTVLYTNLAQRKSSRATYRRPQSSAASVVPPSHGSHLKTTHREAPSTSHVNCGTISLFRTCIRLQEAETSHVPAGKTVPIRKARACGLVQNCQTRRNCEGEAGGRVKYGVSKGNAEITRVAGF